MQARQNLLGPMTSSVTFTDDTVAFEDREENLVKPGAENSGSVTASSHPRVVYR